MARIEVESEVTGRIWKIVTESGTKVSEGDTLLILESMKMENEIFSEINGTIKEILVNEDENVGDEDVLMTIELQ